MKRMHAVTIVLLAAGVVSGASAGYSPGGPHEPREAPWVESAAREAWTSARAAGGPSVESADVAASAMSAEATQAKAKRLYDKLAAQPELKPSELESAEYAAFVYGPDSNYIYNHFFAVALMDSKFTVLEQARGSGMLQLDYYGGLTVAFSRSDKAGETLRAHTDSTDATRRYGMTTGWPETGGKLVRMEKDDYKWALELAKLLQTR